MSASEQLPRPPQVTLVGWLIVIGSLFVVFTAVETLGGIRSMESLQRLEDYLTDGPGASLGWSVETGVQALRIAAMITATCAAAAAVLGWFVLRRDRGARIGVTVLAVPLFLSGAVTGGFVSSMVAAAAVLLWLQPSRDWFDGKPMRTPQGLRESAGSGASQTSQSGQGDPFSHRPLVPPADPTGPPPEGGARPVHGFGDPAGGQQSGQQGQWVGPYASYAGQGAPQPPARRPRAVTVAAVVTFLFAGAFFLSALATFALLSSSPDQVLDQLGSQRDDLIDQGLSEGELVNFLRVSSVMLAMANLAALVAAVMTVRGNAVGRVLLLVTAAAAAGFFLLGALVAPPAALPGLAGLAVVVLLMRADVRAWFTARGRR